MKTLLLAAFSVSMAAAQVIAPNPGGFPTVNISPALRQYLEITNEQFTAMNRLNVELMRFRADKGRRASQVYAELQDEMQKQTLDPMALGLRYVELEAIQRELTAKAKDTATEVQKLFTPAQKNKLQALIDILRSYPLACEAASLNLITPDPNQWFNTSGFMMPGVISGTGSATGGMYYPGGGCAIPAMRNGDFSGLIVP